MSIQIQEYRAELKTVTTCSLQFVSLRGDLVVYSLTSNRTHEHQGDFRITQPADRISGEGIAWKADIEAFLARPDAQEKILSLKSDIPDSGWSFVTKEARSYIAANGFVANNKPSQKIMSDAIYNRPYTAFLNGDVTIDDLCVMAGGSMIFDADLNPLPVGIYMDYIDARLHNELYDLKKASQILRARTDIKFFNYRRDNINPKQKSVILDIPRYNRDSGRDRYISILWTPSAEDMKAIWEKCKEMRPSRKTCRGQIIDDSPFTDRHRAIFALDLLGLRAGGAALHQDFHGTSYVEDVDSWDYEPFLPEDHGQFDEDEN